MADEKEPAPAGSDEKTVPEPTKPVYEANPKHSEPWQSGARGRLCEKNVRPMAQKLLDESTLYDGARYAVHEGHAYCAQRHQTRRWHGYPTGWRNVPAKLRTQWVKADRVKKRPIDKY